MSASVQPAEAQSAPASLDFAKQIAGQIIDEIQRRGIVVPEYLDSAGAAVYLGMSIDWLAKARCECNGPKFSKVSNARGGAVRYKRSDLDAFMAARTYGGRA